MVDSVALTGGSGHCLNSEDIRKLFQPQWENPDNVVPVASYSATQLYSGSVSNVSHSSSDLSRLNAARRSRTSSSSGTLSSTTIDASCIETVVDEDLRYAEPPSKRGRTEGYYPLAMAKRQNRAAQAAFRQSEESQQRALLHQPFDARSSGSGNDRIVSPGAEEVGAQESWYYPPAMTLAVQSAQSAQPSNQDNDSGTGIYPKVTENTRQLSSRSAPRPEQEQQIRCPLCKSAKAHSLCKPDASTGPSGIYGGFFAPQQQQMPRQEWQHPSKTLAKGGKLEMK